MSKQPKIEFNQLEAGYQFRSVSYEMDFSMVSTYLKAVEETSRLYQTTELVPPMAVAARAMAALSEGISLPSGIIHVSQELEFIDTVCVGDTIICNAKVLRKHERGGLHLMTVGLDVFNQNQKKVLVGKTSFVLPEAR